MTLQRILLIAPAADSLEQNRLNVVPEIDALYDLGYNVQVVQERVTRDRLSAIIRGHTFEIVHFAGDAGPEGWQLGNGTLMEPAAIVQLARSVGARLVFINGAASAELGQLLVDEQIPAVICVLGRVDNAIAKETAQLFYQRLAEMRDIRSAYNASKPPIKGGYSLFTNGSGPSSELLAPILERLDQLSETVNALKTDCTTVAMLKHWGLRVFVASLAVILLINLGVILIVKAT